MPLVSILISVYNQAEFIKETINSILNQTFQNFELIIVDDASIDTSLSIIKSYKDNRIKVIQNAKNIGLTQSLNKGLKQCSGEFVARLDADDMMTTDRLEKQLNFLQNNPNVDIIGTQLVLINQEGGVIKKMNHWPIGLEQNIFFVIIGDNPVAHPSVLIRKKLMNKLNGYNPNYSSSQDVDLWYRGYLSGYLTDNLTFFSTYYRQHDKQISNLQDGQQIKNHKVAFNFFCTQLLDNEIKSDLIDEYFNIIKNNNKIDLDKLVFIVHIFFKLLFSISVINNLDIKSQRKIWLLFLQRLNSKFHEIDIIVLIKLTKKYRIFHLNMLFPLWKILRVN
tara:strand:+ start:5268 stop:6272 length:1005 start_codon:yes stop_codon:yes gene_type:complete